MNKRPLTFIKIIYTICYKGDHLMKTNKRINEVKKYLDSNGFTTVTKLAEVFSVSAMTIRRDLNSLEELNLVKREKGGAYPRNPAYIETKYERKKIENVRAKRRIAIEGNKLIEDGDIVFLDAGTTTFMLMESILEKEYKNLTVVTNDISIAFYMMNREDINMIFIGGNVSKATYSTQGYIAKNNIEMLHFDKCFLGISYIDSNYRLYTPTMGKVEYKKIVLQNSNEKILLADSSKFNKNSLYFIADMKEFNVLITEKNINYENNKYFLENRIKVIIA